jgi:hypothetical protein
MLEQSANPASNPEPVVYTVAQVGKLLGLSLGGAYEAIQRGASGRTGSARIRRGSPCQITRLISKHCARHCPRRTPIFGQR